MTDQPANLKSVLIVAGGNSSTPIWQPLSSVYDLCFLYPNAVQFARESGIGNCAAVTQLLSADDGEKAENDVAWLTARVVASLPTIRERAAKIYGAQLPAELNGQLDGWWAGMMSNVLRQQLVILAGLESLKRQRKIVGCVVHEDVAPDTRLTVMWCKANKIPTIHLPHAPCHLQDMTDIHREALTDWIVAQGEQVAQFYVDSGYPKERIAVLGAPQWDELYNEHMPSKAEARRVLGLKPDKLAICYQTTWGQTTSTRGEFATELERGLQAVIAAAKKLDAQLMVLVHWNDGRQNAEQLYAQALDAAGVHGLVTKSHKLYLLKAADVLIAQGPSNMCLEAAMLGTPAGYIQTDGFDYATELPPRGKAEDVERVIAEAMAGGLNWNGMLDRYNAAHARRGGATEAAVKFIQGVAV